MKSVVCLCSKFRKVVLRRQGLLAVGVTHACLCHLLGWDEILLKQMLKGFFSTATGSMCWVCFAATTASGKSRGETSGGEGHVRWLAAAVARGHG